MRAVGVRKMGLFTGWLAFLPSVLVTAGCGDSDDSTPMIPCNTTSECYESADLSQHLGRCVAEAYCVSGLCGGACVQPCEVVDPAHNPCRDPARICNEPLMPDESTVWFCTAVPIPCERTEECPAFKPSDMGTWECVEGTCQFPDFRYAVYPS